VAAGSNPQPLGSWATVSRWALGVKVDKDQYLANFKTPSGMNPRDKRPGDRRSLGAGGRPGGAVWYVLGFLLLMAIAQTWFMMPAGKQISYSEFKTAIRSGQVAEVAVNEQTVRGTYKRDVNGSRNFSANRIEDPKLLEDLDAAGVKYTGEFASRWLAELIGWLPLLLLFGIWIFFFRRMGSAEGGVMSFARSKHRVFAEDDVKVSFADVAGVDEAEQELKEIVEFLKNPKKYTTLGGRIPKGVLLVGPPGTGKTLLARAVAGEAKVPFFSLSGSEFVEMFVGVGAARVRDLFSQAEQKAPCIIFIDELDALGRARVQSPMGSHEEREQTLNQLLAEMDGFDSRKAIIIMGATNRPEVLDPALLRPGRFDRQVLVDKPDVKGREEVLRIHTRSVKLSPVVDLKVVAARTAGFAGADLANLVNEAALLAARKDKTSVEMLDFDEAIDRLIAGLEKKRVMSTKEREIVAYHESGHAIVATAIPNMDPVHKISIVQRGFGALGYTMQLPLEDRYLMQRKDLLNQLAVLLGGRTAEEIALGEISTGAQNDIQRATDIARAMVTEWGMSDSIGTINYDGAKRSKFLDIAMGPERGAYAEDTARLIDAEVKRILSESHTEARRILTDRRDMLEAVTRRLLEVEVMEGEELRRIMGLSPVPELPPDADTTPLPITPGGN
jgi:cell division protease FtsH